MVTWKLGFRGPLVVGEWFLSPFCLCWDLTHSPCLLLLCILEDGLCLELSFHGWVCWIQNLCNLCHGYFVIAWFISPLFVIHLLGDIPKYGLVTNLCGVRSIFTGVSLTDCFSPAFVPCGLSKAWLMSLVLLTALYPRLDKLSYGISVNGLVVGVFPIVRVYSQEQGLCH